MSINWDSSWLASRSSYIAIWIAAGLVLACPLQCEGEQQKQDSPTRGQSVYPEPLAWTHPGESCDKITAADIKPLADDYTKRHWDTLQAMLKCPLVGCTATAKVT